MFDKDLILKEINQLGELYVEQETAAGELIGVTHELEDLYAEYDAKEADVLDRKDKAEIKAEVTKQIVAKQIDFLISLAKREKDGVDPTPDPVV